MKRSARSVLSRSAFLGLLAVGAAMVNGAACVDGTVESVGGPGAEGEGADDAARARSALTGQPISRQTRLAAVLVRWGASDAVDVTATRAALFNNSTSVRNQFLENSFGQHDISGDAFGPFVIAAPASCDVDAIRIAAEAAASAAGVNLAPFTNVAIYFPRSGLCSFSGLGQQGTPALPARYLWLNGRFNTAAHELGHNFGLFDAQGYRCPGTIGLRPTCSIDAFGDPFDPMGSGLSRHFNAYEKTIEGWFGKCNVVNMPRSRTLDIFPIETATNGVQSVRVPMSPTLCPTGITSCRYVIEYRRPIGFDGPSPGVTGVLIHVASTTERINSYLLDMTPATTNFRDAALAVGSTFTDPNGVAVTVNAASADFATVHISVPGKAAPTCLDGSAF